LATLVVLAFDLESRGVAVLGALPGGLPRLALPTFDHLRQLTPLAVIITLVIMMQTATVTYSFPSSSERKPDVDRDFVGLSASHRRGVGNSRTTSPLSKPPPLPNGSARLASSMVVRIIVHLAHPIASPQS